MDLTKEIPMGFGMALAKNTDAMAAFSALTKKQQQSVIEQTHTISSKREMQEFVNTLTQNAPKE